MSPIEENGEKQSSRNMITKQVWQTRNTKGFQSDFCEFKQTRSNRHNSLCTNRRSERHWVIWFSQNERTYAGNNYTQEQVLWCKNTKQHKVWTESISCSLAKTVIFNQLFQFKIYHPTASNIRNLIQSKQFWDRVNRSTWMAVWKTWYQTALHIFDSTRAIQSKFFLCSTQNLLGFQG